MVIGCIHIGSGAYLSNERFVSAVPLKGRAINKIVQNLHKTNSLIDVSYGKKKKTIIFTTTGVHFITALSAKGCCIRYVNSLGVITHEEDKKVTSGLSREPTVASEEGTSSSSS